MEDIFPSQNILIGMRQVLREASSNKLKEVYIAKDADRFLTQKVISACDKHKIPYIIEFTKQHMGTLAKIQVDAAVIGVCK